MVFTARLLPNRSIAHPWARGSIVDRQLACPPGNRLRHLSASGRSQRSKKSRRDEVLRRTHGDTPTARELNH
jgi:hypothetical protein